MGNYCKYLFSPKKFPPHLILLPMHAPPEAPTSTHGPISIAHCTHYIYLEQAQSCLHLHPHPETVSALCPGGEMQMQGGLPLVLQNTRRKNLNQVISMNPKPQPVIFLNPKQVINFSTPSLNQVISMNLKQVISLNPKQVISQPQASTK
jgi:hypothetical protein